MLSNPSRHPTLYFHLVDRRDVLFGFFHLEDLVTWSNYRSDIKRIRAVKADKVRCGRVENNLIGFDRCVLDSTNFPLEILAQLV
jgi:hypothetical protein